MNSAEKVTVMGLKQEIDIRLEQYYTDAERQLWWFSKHPQLDSKRPIEVLDEEHGGMALHSIIDRLDSDGYL